MSPALILAEDSRAGADFAVRAKEILQFTGIAPVISSHLPAHSVSCVITQARTFLKSVRSSEAMRLPTLIFAGADADACRALTELAGARCDVAIRSEPEHLTVSKSGEAGICGPFAGLAFGPVTARNFTWLAPAAGVRSLVTARDRSIGFARTGEWFFCGAAQPADLSEAHSNKLFDVKSCFFELVAPLLFLRHISGEFPRRTAGPLPICLTVDDPLLREKYGCFRFREVLQVLDREQLALSVGLIPWNFRRTDPGTAALLRAHPLVSLTVHGCDHTKHEFKPRDFERANWLAAAALQRMEAHRARYGVPFEPVMVFPEGAFSQEAVAALRSNNYIAALNTHASADGDATGPTLRHRIEPANMNYGAFPILSRRYIAHGIENFAFDLLAGKPCLISTHHHEYAGGLSELLRSIEPVRRLGSFEAKPFGHIIRNLYKQHSNTIEIFSNEICYTHRSTEPEELLFTKTDPTPGEVAVFINGRPAEAQVGNGSWSVRCHAAPGERIHLRCTYKNSPSMKAPGGWLYREKVRWRRYSSEFRDRVLLRAPTIVPVK